MTKRVSCMECANYKNVKRLNICKANNDTMSDYYEPLAVARKSSDSPPVFLREA